MEGEVGPGEAARPPEAGHVDQAGQQEHHHQTTGSSTAVDGLLTIYHGAGFWFRFYENITSLKIELLTVSYYTTISRYYGKSAKNSNTQLL